MIYDEKDGNNAVCSFIKCYSSFRSKRSRRRIKIRSWSRQFELLEEHPEIRIELRSHTDRRGSEEYNNELSMQRAQSVANYLFQNGVHKDRVVTMGLGKSEPKKVAASLAKRYDFIEVDDVLTESFINELSSEQQEIADQLNRRTDFKIIGFKN